MNTRVLNIKVEWTNTRHFHDNNFTYYKIVCFSVDTTKGMTTRSKQVHTQIVL